MNPPCKIVTKIKDMQTKNVACLSSNAMRLCVPNHRQCALNP